MCGSLAKFTRNLVAGVAENQTRALCVVLSPYPFAYADLLLKVRTSRISGDCSITTRRGLQWKTMNVRRYFQMEDGFAYLLVSNLRGANSCTSAF
jgi:hypothetical protein